MLWIKVCGITNIQDAQDAVAAGTDAVGFVFAASKRKVTADTVREIIKELPDGIEKIGVFVDEKEETVKRLASYCGLTGIQLHGEESFEYCRMLSEDGYNVIKAVRVKDKIDEKQLKPYLDLNAILLDTYKTGQPGGTGEAFDWKAVLEYNWENTSYILAGGLHAGNVAEAVRITKPFGVDVSSGVEKEPGKKDGEKLREFIRQARRGGKKCKGREGRE